MKIPTDQQLVDYIDSNDRGIRDIVAGVKRRLADYMQTFFEIHHLQTKGYRTLLDRVVSERGLPIHIHPNQIDAVVHTMRQFSFYMKYFMFPAGGIIASLYHTLANIVDEINWKDVNDLDIFFKTPEARKFVFDYYLIASERLYVAKQEGTVLTLKAPYLWKDKGFAYIGETVKQYRPFQLIGESVWIGDPARPSFWENNFDFAHTTGWYDCVNDKLMLSPRAIWSIDQKILLPSPYRIQKWIKRSRINKFAQRGWEFYPDLFEGYKFIDEGTFEASAEIYNPNLVTTNVTTALKSVYNMSIINQGVN